MTMNVTTQKAVLGAAKAKQDVAAASNEIARVNLKATALLARAEAARRANDVKGAAMALRDADEVTREMVLVRAKYQKAVEIATLVDAIASLKTQAQAKRAKGDAKGAKTLDDAADLGAQALAKVSTLKIKVKLPPRTADATLKASGLGQLAGMSNGELAGLDFIDFGKVFNDIGKTVNNVTNQVGKKLNQFGGWVVDNGPAVGTAVGGIVGFIAAGPPGAAVGAAAGGALGQALQNSRPKVVEAAPPPPPPVEPAPPAALPVPAGMPPEVAAQMQAQLQQGRPVTLANGAAGKPAFSDPTAKVAAKHASMADPKMLLLGGGGLAVVGVALAIKKKLKG